MFPATPQREDQAVPEDPPALFFDLGWVAGYGWVFPEEEGVIPGIGGLKQGEKRRVADIFRNRLAAGGLEEMVPPPQGRHSSMAPSSGIRPAERPCWSGIPGSSLSRSSAKGSFYAHRTGELVVDRALSEMGDAADQYRRLIQSSDLS